MPIGQGQVRAFYAGRRRRAFGGDRQCPGSPSRPPPPPRVARLRRHIEPPLLGSSSTWCGRAHGQSWADLRRPWPDLSQPGTHLAASSAFLTPTGPRSGGGLVGGRGRGSTVVPPHGSHPAATAGGLGSWGRWPDQGHTRGPPQTGRPRRATRGCLGRKPGLGRLLAKRAAPGGDERPSIGTPAVKSAGEPQGDFEI